MITDQDVTKLKKTFLTKEEFKKAAKDFASKKVLNTLSNTVDNLVYELGDIKVEIAEIKETLTERIEKLDAKIDSKFDSLDTKLDRFLGNIDNLQTESNVCTVVQRRHTEQIDILAANAGIILPA